MIWKPLKPLVVAMGNFIFMILYKLASTFEDNKQHKLKKKKTPLFTYISAAFRRVELCSTNQHALQNSTG